jgi:hypothetical protein
MLRLLQKVAPRRCRRQTKEREHPRALRSQQPLQGFKFQRVALHMMRTTNRSVLHFNRESASSRAQLGNVAREVSISATKRDATVQSHTTFAPTLTDKR